MKNNTVAFSGYRPHKLPYGGDENNPLLNEIKMIL